MADRAAFSSSSSCALWAMAPSTLTDRDTRTTGSPLGAGVTGVIAVVMNVTVTAPTAFSYLTIYPAGESKPLASNLNYIAGQTVPNLAMAKLGAGGRVSIANAAGTTHVVAESLGGSMLADQPRL